jgi:hypothetical protein
MTHEHQLCKALFSEGAWEPPLPTRASVKTGGRININIAGYSGFCYPIVYVLWKRFTLDSLFGVEPE